MDHEFNSALQHILNLIIRWHPTFKASILKWVYGTYLVMGKLQNTVLDLKEWQRKISTHQNQKIALTPPNIFLLPFRLATHNRITVSTE